MNRDEYMATVSDLFDMHMDVSDALPIDGAGGEGFDNAAETLFLSPLHAEKYMDLAKFVLDYAAKEHKSRAKIFTAKPGNGVTPKEAANRILRQFLPRAFRRPINDTDVAPYQSLFDASYLKTKDFEPSILFALKGVLVSPQFLYRVETPGSLDQYELASRLSYFLWGSMPDELLFDIAAAGKLNDPEVMKYMIGRMVRNDRFIDFSRRFTGQWLRTRDLDGTKAPDAKMFPMYAEDEELRGDIRFQPILFFREVFLKDMSVLNFIDSKGTIGTMKLQKHLGVTLPLRPNARNQQQWVELPAGSNRGGLLGMPAVLAVSSHPYRSSPVLRGAWILDTLLGTPPPPPPPNVPPLEEHKEGAAPTTVRERLTQHRENPVCASCHSRIDGLGFALENYDTVGRWRDEDAGKPIDNTGELNDGTKFKGPAELRAVLLERKDLFVRNLASKMLGYALGRGLTLRDSCAVDAIVAEVKRNDYSSRSLLEAVVFSVPFQQQAPAPSPAGVAKEKPRS
jgi:hypothetical protein